MLKIYGIPLSPFVRKVQWALAHKEIEYESVPVMPGDASPEFRAISPLGKIPVMQQDDGFSLPDSSIIVRYLDATFPQNPLYPSDARDNATVSWLEEFADTKLVEACATFFRQRFINPNMMKQPTDQSVVDDAEANLMPPLLQYLEATVQASGYFFGGSLSVADLSITSAFVNAQYGDYQVDKTKYPKLAGYLERAMQTPLVKDQLAKEQVIMQAMG